MIRDPVERPSSAEEHSGAISSPTVHLPFLDGMRGLAAVLVLLCHLHEQQILDFEKFHWSLSPTWNASLHWLQYGIDAVSVFIILSGFCLMLPLVQNGGQLRDGLRGFFRRRFRRIVPAYYAALLITLLGIYAKHYFVTHGRSLDATSDEWTGLSLGSVLSHFLLLHNVRPDWQQQIDTPMWSIAVEWQIYFLFALALLPLYRRWGIAAALLLSFAVGYAPLFLLPADHNFDWSAPWYAGLFGLGMLGAVIVASDHPRLIKIRDRLPWGVASLAGILLTYVVVGAFLRQRENAPLMALCVGITAICIILHCATRTNANSLLRRVLSSPLPVALGAFSYSLYLIHDPLIGRLWLVLKRLHHPALYAPALWITGLMISVAAAYVFHLAFERPFLRRKPA